MCVSREKTGIYFGYCSVDGGNISSCGTGCWCTSVEIYFMAGYLFCTGYFRCCCGCWFNASMAFISSSSYIYQDGFGLSSQEYSYFFAFNAIGMLGQQKNDTGSASSLISSITTVMGSIGMILVSLNRRNPVRSAGRINILIGVLCGVAWLITIRRPLLSKIVN